MTERMGYAEIAAHFRQQIIDSKLRPGDALPSMKDVGQQFGVAGNTVSRAFKMLKDEGLTISKWGGPTLVSGMHELGTGTGAERIDRLRKTGNQYAPGETSTDHRAELTSLRDVGLCRELDVDPGDEIVLRRRTFRKEGTPTYIAFSFIQVRAMHVVPEILQQGSLTPFWHDTYEERTGQKVTQSPQRRSARLANVEELRGFEINLPEDIESVAAAVLVLRTTFHDDEGPLSVWEDIYRPGLWQVARE